MISTRYHVVSVAAVFFALALGVVLGSTSVSENMLARFGQRQQTLQAQVRDLRAQRNALDGKLVDARRFGSAIAPMAVQGKLDNESVVLITTADVRGNQRQAMTRILAAAGAEVTGTVLLTENFTDPRRLGRLRDLAARLLPAGVRLPVTSNPGTLAGGLLGPLLLVEPESGRPQVSAQQRAAAFAGLREGGYVRVPQSIRPADLAVVLTGYQTGRSGADHADESAAMLARFSAQLDRSGAGAVLAGTTGSAHGNGAIGVARADRSIASITSTVDNADTPAGRVATVLALREQASGGVGHYGAAGSADSAVPA